MKMAEKPLLELLYKYTRLTLYIDNKDRLEVVDMISGKSFDTETDYELVLRKKRKRRSKDQNAYAWELIGQLASNLKVSTKEVYRHFIRDMSKFEVIPMKREAIRSFERAWEKDHIGRICEDLGESKALKGYHNIKVHYGTSDYDKQEMSHFLELVIQECNQQGIPTLTPKEIERLGIKE